MDGTPRALDVLAWLRREYVVATGYMPPIAPAAVYERWAEHDREIARREAEIDEEYRRLAADSEETT